jgi:hypothetical protein
MNRHASSRRLRTVAAVALAVAAITVAAAPGAHAGGRAPDLPPSSRAALARLFDPQLEKLGLRTTRALLQSLETYRSDAEGTHLAIYVEPIDSMTDAEFLANITKVSRIFLPRVFKEWQDLESFDVCQEPVPGVDDRESPPPVTQLLVSRKGAKRVRWPKATLQDILEAAQLPPGSPPESTRDFFLFVNAALAKQPAYLAASAAATTSTTSATTPAG